jgi:hypothetical protein
MADGELLVSHRRKDDSDSDPHFPVFRYIAELQVFDALLDVIRDTKMLADVPVALMCVNTHENGGHVLGWAAIRGPLHIYVIHPDPAAERSSNDLLYVSMNAPVMRVKRAEM